MTTSSPILIHLFCSPGVTDLDTRAANQGLEPSDIGPCHVNELVGKVAGCVAARGSSYADIELDLDETLPTISGNGNTLGFVLGAVLVAQMLAVSESRDGDPARAPSSDNTVKIKTQRHGTTVSISVLARALPDLDTVRALAGGGAGKSNPTMAHCRRLMEQEGGCLTLQDDEGMFAFELAMPSLPLTIPFRARAGAIAKTPSLRLAC